MSKLDKDKELAKAGGPLATQEYDYGADAGGGFDQQTSEDLSIPYLGILQSNSPEISGEPGKRIKGAEVGMLINTVTKELFDGAKGVIFQPCDTSHLFVEWKPRNKGGGFVKIHALDSEIVKQARATQEFGSYMVGDNELNETFYLTGLMHRVLNLGEQILEAIEPMMIAFTSTKIKAYKGIMTRLRTIKGTPPLFAHRLQIKTRSETNSSGTFSNFVIEAAVNNDVLASLIPPKSGEAANPLLIRGRELLTAFRAGSLKVNHGGDGGGGGKSEKDIPF